jgi:high-affinity K+ transport system ATPase subunit B|tara:strand:- start:127 stop:417 length:291 start_codon:yes stop_codon:yes gene_type:complete
MPEKKRKTNAFEKLLLLVGLLVLVIGYFLINRVLIAEGHKLSWGFLQTVFLWLLMVIFIVMLAIGEDIKEGILLDQAEEIRGMREDMQSFLRKKKS